MRSALAIICSLALVGFVTAEDKVTLDGKVCCNKCELGKADKCQTVVVVKAGDKETVYFFDKASDKKFHRDYCQGSTDAKVSGTVSEKDGKKWIAVSKIEKKSS